VASATVMQYSAICRYIQCITKYGYNCVNE
jgi:hypothetical protein